MTRVAGLDHLTLLVVAPPELVAVAAAAGFDAVGLRVAPGHRTTSSRGRCARLADAGRDRAAARRHRARRARRRGDPARAVAGPRLRAAGARDGGRARRPVSQRDLRRPGPDPAVRPVRPSSPSWPGRTASGRSSSSWPTGRCARWPARVAIAAGSDGGRVLLDALHVQRCGVSLGRRWPRSTRRCSSYVQLCDAPLAAPAGEGAELHRGPRRAAAARPWRAAASGLLGRAARGHPGGRGGAVPAARRRAARRNSRPGRGVALSSVLSRRRASLPGKGAAIVTAPARGPRSAASTTAASRRCAASAWT